MCKCPAMSKGLFPLSYPLSLALIIFLYPLILSDILCLMFSFIAAIKQCDQWQIEEKGFIWLTLTGFLPMAQSVYCKTETIYSEQHQHPLAGPYQKAHDLENVPQTCLQVNLMVSISQLRFLFPGYIYVCFQILFPPSGCPVATAHLLGNMKQHLKQVGQQYLCLISTVVIWSWGMKEVEPMHHLDFSVAALLDNIQ